MDRYSLKQNKFNVKLPEVWLENWLRKSRHLLNAPASRQVIHGLKASSQRIALKTCEFIQIFFFNSSYFHLLWGLILFTRNIKLSRKRKHASFSILML